METCRVCGKPLPKMPPSQQRIYCSMTCMGMDRRSLPAVKTCEVCGKEWQPATRYQAARNKTCSASCNAKRISQAKAGKHIKPAATCLHCGRAFWTRSKALANAKYCSRSCRSKAYAHILIPHAGNMKGRKRRDPRRGPDNPSWKGGVMLKRTHGNYQGVTYVRCPLEYLPMARADGYIMEHRLVMAQKLGRLLTRQEVVHHRDHNPANNHPDNLELFPNNAAHKRAEGAASRSSLKDSAQP